jgi:hypothetical protein
MPHYVSHCRDEACKTKFAIFASAHANHEMTPRSVSERTLEAQAGGRRTPVILAISVLAPRLDATVDGSMSSE